jgi:subtilisin family serine protease
MSLRLPITFAAFLALAGCAPAASNEQKVTSNQIHFEIFSRSIATIDLNFESKPWTDPLFKEQWYFSNKGQVSPHGTVGVVGADIQFNFDEMISESAEPVVVAIIDSGIDLNHPDVDLDKIYKNLAESGVDENGTERSSNGLDDDNNGLVDDSMGWSFADNSPLLTDAIGHGTHVAGLLVSKTNNKVGIGTPWRGIKVLPIQIFSGKRPSPEKQTIAKAIRYAVNRGARVISASFGSPSQSEEIKQAVEYAALHDVVFVSAVGNFRKNHETETSFPAGYNLQNQISVGASERRDLAATFSNFGKNVDIFAPGDEIISLSTGNTYSVRSGTSQACPLVAGAAATARVLNPTATAPEIKALILRSADEQKGLMGFSGLARRLNVDNLILGKEGKREPKSDFSSWQTQQMNIESEHPYRSNLRTTYDVKAPAHTRFFRLRFKSFSTQSTDTLEIRNQENSVVSLLSGELGERWSPVLAGDTAQLVFTTDKFVSDHGWLVDRIEFMH